MQLSQIHETLRVNPLEVIKGAEATRNGKKDMSRQPRRVTVILEMQVDNMDTLSCARGVYIITGGFVVSELS